MLFNYRCCCASLFFTSSPLTSFDHYYRRQNIRRFALFQKITSNIKEEIKKDKDFQQQLKNFQLEAEKLENSEALKQARSKFKKIEEQSKGFASQFKDSLCDIKDTLSKKGSELASSDYLSKPAAQIQTTASAIASKLPVDSINKGAKIISENLKPTDNSLRFNVYQTPTKLISRSSMEKSNAKKEELKANTDQTGMEIHKDSLWQNSWEKFKKSNPKFKTIFRIVESASDSKFVQATGSLSQKLSSFISSLSSQSELQQVIKKIHESDPSFTVTNFLNYCEQAFVPNVMESWMQGNTKILKEWCHENVFNVMTAPIDEAQKKNKRWDNKIIDISDIDLISGKIMDQGPVLIISFVSQQTSVLREISTNKIAQGEADKVERMTNIWAICRDDAATDPFFAWKLIDANFSTSDTWF